MMTTSHARHWKPLLFFVVVCFTTTLARDEINMAPRALYCSDITDGKTVLHKTFIVDEDKNSNGLIGGYCARPVPYLPFEPSYAVASHKTTFNPTRTLARDDVYCLKNLSIISCSCGIRVYTNGVYDINLRQSFMDVLSNKCVCEYTYSQWWWWGHDISVEIISTATCGKKHIDGELDVEFYYRS